VQDGDPGEIEARSQNETQQDAAKRGAKKERQNGKKSKTVK